MSDPQPGPVGDGVVESAQERLNKLHTYITTDDRPDTRFIRRLSNRQKTLLVSKALAIPPAALDLTLPAPLERWCIGGRREQVTAGMYLADLRVQFFKLVRSKLTAEAVELEQLIADSEFWLDKFSDQLHTLNTGEQPAARVLH